MATSLAGSSSSGATEAPTASPTPPPYTEEIFTTPAPLFGRIKTETFPPGFFVMAILGLVFLAILFWLSRMLKAKRQKRIEAGQEDEDGFWCCFCVICRDGGANGDSAASEQEAQERREAKNDTVWQSSSKISKIFSSSHGKNATSGSSGANMMKPIRTTKVEVHYTDLPSYHWNTPDTLTEKDLPNSEQDFNKDPRTGLPLLNGSSAIPSSRARPFANFSKSILHFFGNGNLVEKDSQGGKKQRVLVASDVCLYVCQVGGNIERCIPHANLKQIGMGAKDRRIVIRLAGATGGDEGDICLELEDPTVCENLLNIIEKCNQRLASPDPKDKKSTLPVQGSSVGDGNNSASTPPSLAKVLRLDRIPHEALDEPNYEALKKRPLIVVKPRPLGQLLEALKLLFDKRRKEQLEAKEAEARQRILEKEHEEREAARKSVTFAHITPALSKVAPPRRADLTKKNTKDFKMGSKTLAGTSDFEKDDISARRHDHESLLRIEETLERSGTRGYQPLPPSSAPSSFPSGGAVLYYNNSNKASPLNDDFESSTRGSTSGNTMVADDDDDL